MERSPLLAEAEAWAVAHLYLLEVCFARFSEAGEWPTLEELQHDFELKGRCEDVAQLAFAMPRPLGFVEQQRLVLLVRALKYVPAAGQLLQDWASILMLAYRKWRDDPAAELKRDEVLRLLGGDQGRTKFVALLLLRERWPFGSGRGGPDDEWSQEIISAVRAARNATGPEGIIVARDAIEYPPLEPPPEPTLAEKQDRQLSWLRRAWNLISENTLIASTIAGVLVLLIGAYVIHSSAGGRSSSESSESPSNRSAGSETSGKSGMKPFREQAGADGARTFTKPAGSTEGPRVSPNQHVLVACRVYDPEPESVLPDGYWYRLASRPWNSAYYAPANSFWNGDVPGRKPYIHNTDFAVPAC